MAETVAEAIVRIKGILSSGASSITTDGVTTAIDRTELRRQLRELQAIDQSTGKQRPVIQRPYLGGW